MKNLNLRKLSQAALCIICLAVFCSPAVIVPSTGAQVNPQEFEAQPEMGAFVRYWDGAHAACRQATKEEAIAINERTPDVSLRAIPRPGRNLPDSPATLTIILRGTPQLDSFPAGSVQPADTVFNRGTGEGWLDGGDV